MSELIKGFIKDERLSNEVKKYLTNEFTKKRDWNDVPVLAARAIALDMLNQAWRDMESTETKKTDPKPLHNIGV